MRRLAGVYLVGRRCCGFCLYGCVYCVLFRQSFVCRHMCVCIYYFVCFMLATPPHYHHHFDVDHRGYGRRHIVDVFPP